ncbi:MAG: class I SAM-dependent methyltransferase [Gemmatimonadetes bacterium]|nr:class I SAM-dependent methyltransferase [Gemmatimonadota bacterium]
MSLPYDDSWARLGRGVAIGVGRTYAPVGGRVVFLQRRLASFLIGEILDVGAGANGKTLGDALGSRYHALDIGTSYKIVNTAERAALHYVADIEGKPLPFGDGQFDTVLCMDVLEHIDESHLLLDELFRVARRAVIVSLPNNWPGFLWSIVLGRNITHRSGYGLDAQAKPPGQRHKHFFNFEEAFRFLFGRVPPGFRVAEAHFVFEHGNDGLLASAPWWNRWFRVAGKASPEDLRARVGPAAYPLWLVIRLGYGIVHSLDTALSALLYGWGSRVRFYNLFCRQLWVVYERKLAPILN